MPVRGRYVAFSGLDGSGKTTQSKILAAKLMECGIEVTLTREPGSPLIGFNVRDLLLGHTKIDPVALEILFQADRAEHTTKINDLLEQGRWVISDRSYICGWAYGLACGHSAGFLLDLMRHSVKVKPDVAFIMDIPTHVSAARKAGDQLTREEVKGSSFAMSVRANYLGSIEGLPREMYPQQMTLISGDGPVDEISKTIWTTIFPFDVHAERRSV